MFTKEWNVLIVDDEPDVLSVSKLAMRNFTVYGLPIKIHTAQSKAEALEVLNTKLMRRGGYLNLPVAFIDVVMESDNAGLELCQHIRETMRNKITALYVRTGQPGLAPEREVIDRYDISGYFTKVEATEDKLYSLVKSGVRQFYSAGASFAHSMLLHQVLAAGSAEGMVQALQRALGEHEVDAAGNKLEEEEFRRWIIAGDKVLAGPSGASDQDALAACSHLSQLPGVPLSKDGDKWVTEGNNVLIKVAGSGGSSDVYNLMACTFPPPDFVMFTIYQFLKSFSILWARANPAAQASAAG
jgi:CheY-like chemotaxis protein